MIVNRKDLKWFLTSIRHDNKDISDDDLIEQLAKYMETNPSCIDMDVVSDTAKLYHPVILGDVNEAFKQIREVASGYYIRKIIREFASIVAKAESFPTKLAFSFSDSKVFIWAEIKENDEVADHS